MLEIKTAAELSEADVEFQASRRAARQTPVLQGIYRLFLDRGDLSQRRKSSRHCRAFSARHWRKS
jgi:hypothetical protein